MMFEQCNIVIFNNIIFMKKYRKFSGKMQWKFSEIFRKNMKFSGQIFRLTSLATDDSTAVTTSTTNSLLLRGGPAEYWETSGALVFASRIGRELGIHGVCKIRSLN